jgi:predicted nucleotidyltransferase
MRRAWPPSATTTGSPNSWSSAHGPRGAARPDSDIDVLYTLRPGRRLGWEIEQLADELAELFGRQVDLVSLRALHPLLRTSVLAEARPVYAA